MQKGRMAKNTTYLTAALTVQKILAFIYFWFISNSLVPGQLGQYVFALSYTTLFSIFVDLGLSPVLTRESSKDQSKANEYLQNVLGIKLPLSLIAVIAAILFINITGKPAEVKILVYIASAIMVLDSFTLSFWVMFRAHHKLIFESIATVIVQCVIFGLGYAALRLSGQVSMLIAALLVASLFNFAFSALLVKFKLGYRLTPTFDRRIIMSFMTVLPAFALAGIFNKIYNTADSVLLGYIAGDEAVGFFAIPAKVVYALQQVIPAAFAAVIFPAFSYYFATSRERLSSVFVTSFSYILAISIPITAGLLSLAPEIITMVWPQYTAVIPTFYAMILAIPFIFLAFPTGYLLNACDLQRINTRNRGITTVISIALNVLLIPVLGYFGAGLTFLLTNILLLTLDLSRVGNAIHLETKKIIVNFSKSSAAALVMATLVFFTKSYLHLLLTILLGATSYFVTLYALKGFRFSELKVLISKN